MNSKKQIKVKLNLKLIQAKINSHINNIQEIRAGNINTKYLLVTENNNKMVLKIYTDRSYISPIFSGVNRAKREFTILKYCERNDILAPKPIALFNNNVVMSFVEGKLIKEAINVQSRIFNLIMQWLTLFHSSLCVDRVPLSKPIDGVFRTLRYALAQSNDAILSDLYSTLCKSSFCPSTQQKITHGDVTLNNWIISEDGKVYGLDFEFSGKNDVLFDIGMLISSLWERDNFNKHFYSHCCSEVFKKYEKFVPINSRSIAFYVILSMILMAYNVPDKTRHKNLLLQAKELLSKYISNHDKIS